MMGGSGNFQTLDDFRMYQMTVVDPARDKFEKDLQRLFKIGLGVTDWKIKYRKLDATPLSQDSITIDRIGENLRKLGEAGILTQEEIRERYFKAEAEITLTRKHGE